MTLRDDARPQPKNDSETPMAYERKTVALSHMVGTPMDVDTGKHRE